LRGAIIQKEKYAANTTIGYASLQGISKQCQVKAEPIPRNRSKVLYEKKIIYDYE